MSEVSQGEGVFLRLDPGNERVWHGDQPVKLTPKAFAVLRYLIERPGRLVTKDDLLRAIWRETVVTEWALTACIYEIRKALGDEARAPQYLETVHRRGYRFIGPLAPIPADGGLEPGVQRQKSEPVPVPNVVGREDELGHLKRWLETALGGERQVVFVVGEAGIGKTALMEAFAGGMAAGGDVGVGWGQCIEHYGAGEAYLPVLEALGQLYRTPWHDRLLAVLRHYAPTWLVHLPWLVSGAELETMQRRVQGATRERMLRELAQALEVLTADGAVALVLEDLHWSDHATLDFVSYLARRRGEARLLVVGTYRPGEVLGRGHPLRGVKQELLVHGQCRDLALEGLSESGVREYLGLRLPGGEPEAGLVQWLHQRTDGNPLFMVKMVDYMLGRGLVVEGNGRWALRGPVGGVGEWVPESLREMIEKQMEELSAEEKQVLEAASVAGTEFSAAAVAAGLEEAVEGVEERCQRLVARKQLLRSCGVEEWPDGAVAGRYAFIHALYQSVIAERVGGARLLQLHRRIGERKEAGYGERTGEIAAELATHFAQGRDHRRAVKYLGQAAKTATLRSAHTEAISLLSRALELLPTLPDTPERTQQELILQISLGSSLIAMKGYAAPEVEGAYTRARELCQRVGETPQLFSVLLGLWAFSLVRAKLQTARALAEQCLRLAETLQGPAFLMQARFVLGTSLFWLGELVPARGHLEHGIALYDSQKLHPSAFRVVHDPGVTCRSYAARVLGCLGYPDQARKRNREALTLAEQLAHPFSLAFALSFGAMLHQCLGQGHETGEQADAAVALCAEHEFALFLAVSTVLGGWALTERGQGSEGMTRMRQGLAAYRATGAEVSRPYFLALVAEAHGRVGQTEEGVALLAEALALVSRTGERWYEAELYRLRGHLLLAQQQQREIIKGASESISEAEACFRQAIAIARRQEAKSLELRAVISLSRLLQSQGRKEEARTLLAEIYGWFTEGLETEDLKEARALLGALEGRLR